MKPGQSKKKGNREENRIAAICSEAAGELFEATRGSGGGRLPADVFGPSWLLWRFLEVKHVKSDTVNLWSIFGWSLKAEDDFLRIIMRKAMKENTQDGHHPALVVHPNHRKELFVVTDWGDRPLEWYDPTIWGNMAISNVEGAKPERLGILLFERFLEVLANTDLREDISV